MCSRLYTSSILPSFSNLTELRDTLVSNITTAQFLNFCKQAIDLREINPQLSEKLAEMMVGLWYLHRNELPQDIANLVTEFMELEAPDAHVRLQPNQTVDSKWALTKQHVSRLQKSEQFI